MKILYVKSNSEREKRYQLQTIIYEENGEKFVKKKALCKEAVPHLMRMQENYDLLKESIISPDLHLAKIIESGNNYLIFEYIEGISIERKILDALKNRDQDLIEREIEQYLHLLKRAFRTKVAPLSAVKTAEGRQILDFSRLGQALCFDQVSNIDLIFSNIIYWNDEIYLIDYEWVLEGAVPINFALFRAFRSLHEMERLPIDRYLSSSEIDLFNAVEKRLIYFEIASANSFYQYREKYDKMRINLYDEKARLNERISGLENEISGLENEIDNLNHQISTLENEVLFYALSRSWKITRPMRKILTYLRGKH